jgi:transcriptional regulator with XRE-family HTH domain
MTVGEKIKQARLERKMTQSDLAGGAVTRNMLSAIESGKASPSLSTLEHIAATLELPLPYLLSGENDLTFYMKKERIGAIKNALASKNYNICISLVTKLTALDDELYFILAQCYFALGETSIKNGSLSSAKKQLTLCREYCARTMYDTARYECMIPLYLAITENVNSPLLEFEESKFLALLGGTLDYEFYKYLTLDFTFSFTDLRYRTHMTAKQLIRERKYADALKLLLEIENTKSDYERNSYLMFCLYADLEICYKQLYDFESAYRFATKRISLMEGFNT